MRNPYTCIFKRTLASRVWSLSPSTRCVWLWLKLQADPEGYVSADLAGVAAGANVTSEEARRAIDGFCSADPDADPDDPHEGRVLERVRGGWLVLDHESEREMAKTETRNARNARYARARRAREATERLRPHAANDVEPTSVPADAPVAPCTTRSKPTITTTVAEDSNSNPPTPLGSAAAASIPASAATEPEPPPAAKPRPEMAPPLREDAPQSTSTIPCVLRRLPDDWSPSEALRAEADMAGVTDLDARINKLREGPIGGARGVFPDKLDDYIRNQFGNWRTWEQTDRAKKRAAEKAPPSSRKPWEPEEPLIDLDLRVLDSNIKRYIEHHGLGEWGPLVRQWLEEATAANKKLTRPEAVKALKGWLAARAKKARAA